MAEAAIQGFLPYSSGVVQPFLIKASLNVSMLSHQHKHTPMEQPCGAIWGSPLSIGHMDMQCRARDEATDLLIGDDPF